MKQIDEIVLGGGIAGLLWAFYHPGAIVITDKVGGQFSAPFQLGPKYLHSTKSTLKLLEDLGVNGKYNQKLVKIGFRFDDAMYDFNTEENRKRYFEKTRGNSSEPYRSSMSGGTTEFLAFDIGVEELVRLLEEKLKDRIIIDKIKEVDPVNNIVKGNEEYHYEKLVVTVPRNVFCYMIGDEKLAKEFVAYPTTFVLLGKDAFNFTEMEKFDYAYFSEPGYSFHRMTKIDKGLVIEIKGDKVPAIYDMFQTFTMKVGQLVHRSNKEYWPENIRFFGRYAEWNHSLKTNELLDKIHEEFNENVRDAESVSAETV